MKVILSRKGFDSSYGGYPSPILPDGRLISLPIPSSPEWDTETYSDLKLDGYGSYFDLMQQLSVQVKNDGKWNTLDINTLCHRDPDIYRAIEERDKDWCPMFGQGNQAQSHLDNQGVQKDDLFLFFGWFRDTINTGNTLKFGSNMPDLHVIFGYLQIGSIERVSHPAQFPTWMQSHSHFSANAMKVTNNTIYIARDKTSWNTNISGSGVFCMNKSLVLTKNGYSRSKWQLPDFFRNVNISRHSASSWKPEGYFKSVDIGQEIVIQDNKMVEDWAKGLIEENQ